MTVAVLCYHDIAGPKERYSWLKVDVERFEQHLLLLKRVANFVHPEEILDRRLFSSRRLHFLLTFDDGLINNYRLGLPVLQRYDIPALFFVSTWHMVSGEPFWFNRIIGGIQSQHIDELDLRNLGLKQYRFNPSGGEKRWDGIQLLLEDIKRYDDKQDGELIVAILAAMGLQGASLANVDAEDRPLNRAEILTMRDSGLCWFGSHGHHHRLLPKLDNNALMTELQLSRQLLQEILGATVLHIAYPNGDTDERVGDACRQVGYRFGYTVTPGKIRGNTDSLRIPRISVGGFDNSFKLLRKLSCCLF